MKLMKIIGILLIIGGVVTICAAVTMDKVAKAKGEALVDTYMSRVESVQPAEDVVMPVGEDETVTPVAQTITIPEGVLGVVLIDKIDLSAPLVEGTDNKSIRYALGHFEGTAMPGEVGNFAVAGHRSYTFGEYFNRLDEMEAGDTIQVMYANSMYTYVVDKSFVVEPEQVEVLNPTEEATITLVTCTPKWSGTHRLIVQGHLQEAGNE